MKILLPLMLLLAAFFMASCAAPQNTQPVSAPASEPPVPEEVVPPEVAGPLAGPEAAPEQKVQASQPPAPQPSPYEDVPFTYPFAGSEDAKMTVTYYGDFADAVNSRVHFGTVPALKRDFVQNGKVKLVFRPVPGKDGGLAAEVSLCSWEQGSQQFWSYSDVLFRFFSQLERDNLVNYADRVPGLDRAALAKCLDSGKYSNIVKASVDSASAKDVRALPTFAVGENMLSGEMRYDDLKAAIQEELGTGSKVTGNLAAAPFDWKLPEFIANLFK